MAGGKITRIVGGKSTTIVEEDFTGYYKNLTMNAGGKNIFTARQTHFGTPKEPEKKDGYFVKGWWTNHKDERIKRAVYGQRLRFHIQMNRERVNVGDIVKFGLYDSDMRSFGNDVIKADDPISLVHTETEKPYTYEEVNAEYKVIIEFTAGYNSLANALIKDKDGIYELYFRCSYENKGREPQHIELPLSFGDYLNLGSIVIDRYKMPGLNPQGTGIAEDMAYGMGSPYKPKHIYSQEIITKYIEEYTEAGFDTDSHSDFANVEQKAIELEEIIITAERKPKEEKEYPPKAEIDNLRVEKKIPTAEDLIKNQEEIRKQNNKAIYSREEIESLGYLMEFSMETDFRLWFNFRTLKSVLAWGELSPVLDAMIDKFQRNEGGVFEDDRLNENIKNADSTKRYCRYLENYIAEKLKNSFDELEEVEDKEIDWGIENEKKLFERRNKNKITGQKDSNGEDMVFTTPLFPYNRYVENNLFEGKTLALNDIWATEVILKELKFMDKENYTAKYEVTLWDHFGLNYSDIEKFYYYGNGFRAWFILQHLKGYKPFITKITFEKGFSGNLNKGK